MWLGRPRETIVAPRGSGVKRDGGCWAMPNAGSEDARADSRRCAVEARGIVRIAAAFVLREPRIRAERAGERRVRLGRDDALGRAAALDPALQRRQRVDLIRSGAAAAVQHAGREE